MYIFDKDLPCIHCQIKLIQRFDKQAFFSISRNILFNHPTGGNNEIEKTTFSNSNSIPDHKLKKKKKTLTLFMKIYEY